MIEPTTAIISLAIVVAGLIGGGAWWMSALYSQTQRIADSIMRMEKSLLSEVGGVNESGERIPGRQNEEREALAKRVKALETIAKNDVTSELARMAGLQS